MSTGWEKKEGGGRHRRQARWQVSLRQAAPEKKWFWWWWRGSKTVFLLKKGPAVGTNGCSSMLETGFHFKISSQPWSA